MKTYQLKTDLVNGVRPNTTSPNVLFRKGDTVRGEIVGNPYKGESLVRVSSGIYAKPTVLGAYIDTTTPMPFIAPSPAGMVFIPLTDLEEVAAGAKTTTDAWGILGSKEKKETTDDQAHKKYLNWAILAVLAIAGILAWSFYRKIMRYYYIVIGLYAVWQIVGTYLSKNPKFQKWLNTTNDTDK